MNELSLEIRQPLDEGLEQNRTRKQKVVQWGERDEKGMERQRLKLLERSPTKYS